MQSRRSNNTQSSGLGSKSKPLGTNFKGTKLFGKSEDVELGLTADEVVEMIELEDTEVVLACKCGTVPIGVAYTNRGEDDIYASLDKSAYQSVERYIELKKRSK